MLALISHLRWFAPYAASILLTKGMALISIPLVTRYLPPADYGRLELVLSFVEIAGIVLSFAIADVLFRLTSEGDEAHAKSQARALAGLTLAMAAGAGLLLQALAFAASGLISTFADPRLLAIGLLGATLSGLIEMPLAWLRCRGRANVFLLYVAMRSMSQIVVMWALLSHGWGALGLLAGNVCVDIVVASALIFAQWRDTGFSISASVLRAASRYGGPLVVGSLAMFVLGACDRWFLAAAVQPADIAHYALAVKLAGIVALAVQPFGLWWYPQRIRALGESGGYERSADAVAFGFAFLMAGVAAVICLAPFMFEQLLPPAYAPALALIPALACIAALNEACSLMNVGAYAGRSGAPALAVNAAGACVALAGYILLTPFMGVAGAILATIAAHAVRLVAFYAMGLRRAPIRYHYVTMAALVAV
ncbi:MAG: lipopolysaccharide biosynthesis protein, partial [Beijerinckiaceae bacterium]|nr:lipopolysaccharide biosynthesis protein [Beijerinckiaceae bacterium]